MNQEQQGEAISTEDMLSRVDVLNEKWLSEGVSFEEGELFVGSLDATALYPSLDSLKVAKLCGRLATENRLAIENVDYVWAGAYIACNMHPEQVFREGLSDCVPRRR